MGYQQRRVLIVDDERLLREAMCDVLGEVHQVDGVGSVAAARQRLGAAGYDVVLCDVTLPDGSAADVCAALGGSTRIVLITGGDAEHARSICGDRPVLRKPFDLDELPALLDALLSDAAAP